MAIKISDSKNTIRAAITASLILSFCFVASSASEQNLIIGEVWAMGGIDPALYSYNLNNFLVAEGLTSISPEFEIVPCIAKSWETGDDDTWRFHLNEDILFHDGSKVTADDVSESLKRTMEMNPSVAVA